MSDTPTDRTEPVPPVVSRFAYRGAHLDQFSERKSQSWRTFSAEDEARLLEAWTLRLTEEERDEAQRFDLENAGTLPAWHPDPSEAWPGHLVAVGMDRLLTVDLKRLILPIPVRVIKWFRATSRLDVVKPVEPALAEALDEAYADIAPYRAAYEDELAAALSQSAEAEARLRSMTDKGEEILFQSGDSARLYASSTYAQASKSLLNRWVPGRAVKYTGGTLVFRGYDAAREYAERANRKQVKASKHRPMPSIDSRASSDRDEAHGDDEEHSDHESGDTTSAGDTATAMDDAASDTMPECGELVLAFHGIGQGVALQWSSWSIVPAVNALRSNALKFAQKPENGALLQNKRLCILPIRWRALLEEATDIFAKRRTTGESDEEDDDEGWSLDDAMPHSLSSFRAIVRECVTDSV